MCLAVALSYVRAVGFVQVAAEFSECPSAKKEVILVGFPGGRWQARSRRLLPIRLLGPQLHLLSQREYRYC